MSTEPSKQWQWENATAGAAAGFATVAVMHPLDVVRTRFQVNDGRASHLPSYKNTAHAIFTITRIEGLRGLYAGFLPGVLGSTLSWGLYFFFYDRAKQRYARSRDEKLSPGLHLASAAEAGALVSLFTNPVWLVKTRLQLQTPIHQTRPYSGLYDAFRTIMREEGFSALYRGIVPGLFLVSHGAIQFTAYEELRKTIVDLKSKGSDKQRQNPDQLLNSVDYAVLGATSKVAAILLTYPFQVIRSRLQQRPGGDGIHRYMDSWHVVKETARFEGVRGFYKGITPNLLKNVPASSITFIVYENVLNKGLPCFQNETLIAIKAPHGTTLEVPDPEEAVDELQRRYRIILRSTMGPIDVYLISQFEEKFEEINGAEPPASLPLASSSGSNEQQVTEMVPAECSGKELEPQALLSSQTYSDLNVSQEFAGGMMKIVPSDADNDADYWLLSDAEVSITDMWRTDSNVDWSGVDMLHPDFEMLSRPQTPSPGLAEAPSTVANPNQR